MTIDLQISWRQDLNASFSFLWEEDVVLAPENRQKTKEEPKMELLYGIYLVLKPAHIKPIMCPPLSYDS